MVVRVVFDFQHAFMVGRQILDVVLIANEAIESRLKDNSRGIIYKVNIGALYW